METQKAPTLFLQTANSWKRIQMCISNEISIVTEGADEAFQLIAITNLDFAKTLHIGKGEIVGFARPEVEEVVYIATTNELNVEPYVDTSPRNWIPP